MADWKSALATCCFLSATLSGKSMILKHQGTNDMDAVLLDKEHKKAEIITSDGIRLTIKHSYSLGWEPGVKNGEWPEVACIIIRLSKEDYLAIGNRVVITFTDAKDGNTWKQADTKIGLAKC